MSNPTPPPGQDPYQQGQPYGDQYGNQYGGQQYGGQGQQQPYAAQQYPPQSPPKKSRTGLVVGILAVVILLVGGGLAFALLGGSDDDTKDKDDNGKDSAALSGETLGGDGYEYQLPKGWKDTTDDAKTQDAPGTIDTVSAWGDKLDNSPANVIVEAGSGVGDADLESLRSTWESNMSGATGSTPQKYDGTTIDGEDAIGVKFERENDDGVAIVQIGYLTVHDGTAYSIILSANAQKKDEALEAYDALLGSWTWE